MDTEMIKICGGGKRPWLSVDSQGELWLKSDGQKWKPVKFQENYQGYYPHCRFNTVAATEHEFLAAGMADDGLPYVFRSLLGGVWEMVNLTASSVAGGSMRAGGKVNEILWDNKSHQIFLLCSNGEFVILPDCPKCVKIRKVADCGLVSGVIGADWILIQTESGEEIRLSAREYLQIRVSMSYASERVKTGGRIIDLKDVDIEDVSALLKKTPKDEFLAFVCEYGVRADEAARYARDSGFTQAFSLGGSRRLFHKS